MLSGCWLLAVPFAFARRDSPILGSRPMQSLGGWWVSSAIGNSSADCGADVRTFRVKVKAPTSELLVVGSWDFCIFQVPGRGGTSLGVTDSARENKAPDSSRDLELGCGMRVCGLRLSPGEAEGTSCEAGAEKGHSSTSTGNITEPTPEHRRRAPRRSLNTGLEPRAGAHADVVVVVDIMAAGARPPTTPLSGVWGVGQLVNADMHMWG